MKEPSPLRLFMRSKIVRAGFIFDTDFAKSVDMSESHLSRILSGKTCPGADIILKFKKTLTLSSDETVTLLELLTGDKPINNEESQK